MNLETPRSPSHCLGILNAHMHTDMLGQIHQGVLDRMDQQDKQPRSPSRRQSPLEMLIACIEDVLAVFDGSNLFDRVQPNPLTTVPYDQRPLHGLATGGFEPGPAYHHDIALLKSQLRSLHDILASPA